MKQVQQFLVLCMLGFSMQIIIAQTPQASSGKMWVPVEELTDEFNGATLDASKWDDYHPHWSGRTPSQFKKGNAYVDGSGNLCLKSTLMQDPTTVGDPFTDDWVWAAACVSKEKSAKPGYYYEARFKASSLSMTSSFWFRVGDYSEIDVIEHVGNPSVESRQDDLPYQYHANTHYYGQYAGTDSKAAEWQMPTRGRDEYHIYGFWWKDANTLWFYHNGEKVMEIIPRYPLEENLKMIFDTEVFPFATDGVANIGLPKVENLNDDTKNTMYVDYVRTYELIDDNGTITDDLSLDKVASSMVSTGALNFSVDYATDAFQTISLELKNPEGEILGTTQSTVSRGVGTQSLTIDMGTYSPTPRADHQVVVSMGNLIESKLIKFTPNESPSGPPTAPSGKTWQAIVPITDEFSGTSLDASKWQPDHPYWNGRSPSNYNTQNVSVADGMLQIISTVANENKTGNWVHSGCVTSLQKEAMPGSYYEASIRGSDISMTSAFWFQGSTTEIDVTENFGYTTKTSDYYVGQRSQMLSNTHSFANGWDNDEVTPIHPDMPAESDHRFFTYGVYWKDAKTIETYLDGVKVGEMTPYDNFDELQYMFFDTETFEWQGLPSLDELRDPDRNMMYVNWVRSYQLVDGESDPGSEIGPEPGAGIELTPIHDAFIQGSTAYNTSDLKVEVNNRTSYLMFDLSSITNEIESAQLVLTVGAETGSGEMVVSLGSHNNWTETSLSTSNAPAASASLASINESYAANTAYTWDLDVTQITAGGQLSLIVSHVSGNDAWFQSKEVSAKPKLIIQTVEEEVVEPSLGDTITIEAESFETTGGTYNDGHVTGNGVNLEGAIINWVNTGDWAEYTINVAEAGSYELSYLIAAPVAGGQIQLFVDNSVVATDDVPQTGTNGDNDWSVIAELTSASAVELTEGEHTIKILASNDKEWQWNLDKIILTKEGVPTTLANSYKPTAHIYPNPFDESVNIEAGQRITGITLYSLSGRVVLAQECTSSVLEINTSMLLEGYYMLSLQYEDGTSSIHKIVK